MCGLPASAAAGVVDTSEQHEGPQGSGYVKGSVRASVHSTAAATMSTRDSRTIHWLGRIRTISGDRGTFLVCS